MRMSKAERTAREAIARQHPFESCGNCDIDGWITITRGGADGWEHGSSYRCTCWYVHQAKVNELVAESLGSPRTPTRGRHAE